MKTILTTAITAAIRSGISDENSEIGKAYRKLESDIARAFGKESDLFEAILKFKKRDSEVRLASIQEEVSLAPIDDEKEIITAAENFLRQMGADHLQKAGIEEKNIRQLKVGQEPKTDLPDNAKLVMQAPGAHGPVQAEKIDNLTQNFHQGNDPESLRYRYLSDLASETIRLPWASVNPDYADPGQGEDLGLVEIYIALDTSELERPETEDEASASISRQKEARRISAQEMIDREPLLVLLGDPGSGKSTLVNYLAHTIARAGQEDGAAWLKRLKKNGPWEHGALLPVRLILRDFAAGLDEKGPADVNLILSYLQNTMQTKGLGEYWPYLCEALAVKKTPCLILLDGLDEVPGSLREKVVSVIGKLVERYPKNRYLVTCRIYAYVGAEYQLHGFRQATLMPFSKDQIEHFVSAWYFELHLRGRFTEKEAAERSGRLKQVANRPDLFELAERPLLMTVMALLHAFRGELPEDRVELYKWAVDLLLRRWEKRIGGDKGLLETLDVPGLKMSHLEAGLYHVAFAVHEGSREGVADIGEGTILQLLRPYLLNSLDKAEQFVNYVRERAGLIIRHKPDAFTFPHRTFQEFMAACHLVGMNDYPSESARLVKEDPDRWRIVFILAAGYAPRGQAIAAINTLCPLSVAETLHPDAAKFRCMEIAGEALLEIGLIDVVQDDLGKAILSRIQNWLLAGMTADTVLEPEKRAAAGSLRSRLGDTRFDIENWYLPREKDWGFVEVPAGPFLMGSGEEQHEVSLPVYRIARYPVTVGQYRAFIKDSGHDPEGEWEGFNEYDNHPVVMVTWYDANQYCEWLTGKLNEAGWIGRVCLPTEPEWEKAARGLDGRIFPWGAEVETNRMNFDETGIGDTSSVGCFPGGKSPYGCLDMAGNVWEWTRSLWGKDEEDFSFEPDFKYPYDPNDGREDMSSNAYRVCRGGSWAYDADDCRTAFRRRNRPGRRFRIRGFRLAFLPGQ